MFKKVLFALLYFLSSLFAIILNKYLIENHKNSSFIILTIQTLFICLLSLPFFEKYNLKRNFKNILYTAILLLLMIISNIFALKKFYLPDFIILKSLSLFIEFKKKYIFPYVLLILSLFSKSFLNYTLYDYCVIIANIFFHYYYLFFFKKTTKKQLNTFSAIFSIQLALLPFLISLSFLSNERILFSPSDILKLLLTSVSIFILNLNTVYTLKIFSPLILNILGCLNKFTIFILHSNPKFNLLMNIFASICYVAISLSKI